MSFNEPNRIFSSQSFSNLATNNQNCVNFIDCFGGEGGSM